MNDLELKKLHLETTLRLRKKDISKFKERLNKDFNNQISWVLRQLYSSNQWVEVLESILEKDEEVESKIENTIKYLSHFVSGTYNVRKNSSCEVTSMTSTWEFMNNVEILEFLKKL